jgi:hypothetical protein
MSIPTASNTMRWRMPDAKSTVFLFTGVDATSCWAAVRRSCRCAQAPTSSGSWPSPPDSANSAIEKGSHAIGFFHAVGSDPSLTSAPYPSVSLHR